MTYPFIIQGSNITIVIDNTPHTISKSHLNYEKVRTAIVEGKWDLVRDLIEPKKVVLKYGAGHVSIQGETVYWKNQPLHNALTNRMIQMLKEDFPIEPLVKFMHNLYLNPSARAVSELYGFLEKNNLPITPDGEFLAFKKVRSDWYDCYSGTVLNKPANKFTPQELAQLPLTAGPVTVSLENGTTVISMERNAVDDDKDHHCSTGLHFCSQEYLKSFGGDRTLIVKVNPRDVVSIPTDYNFSKARTSRYEIVGELNVAPDGAFTKAVQENAVGSESARAAWPEPVASPAATTTSGKRVLSQTKDAIRKRNQRAREKADRLAKSSTPTTNTAGNPRVNPGRWPYPAKS